MSAGVSIPQAALRAMARDAARARLAGSTPEKLRHTLNLEIGISADEEDEPEADEEE